MNKRDKEIIIKHIFVPCAKLIDLHLKVLAVTEHDILDGALPRGSRGNGLLGRVWSRRSKH